VTDGAAGTVGAGLADAPRHALLLPGAPPHRLHHAPGTLRARADRCRARWDLQVRFLLFDETVLWLIHPRDKDLIFLFLLLLTKKFVLADWRWPRHRPSAWAAAALLATASSSDDDSELLVLINAPEVSTFSWCASKTVCIVAILMLNV
jgi:hypothetical protein